MVFSPKVDPEDVLLISVLLEDGLEALLETLHRGLTSTEEGEARELKISMVKRRTNLNIIFSEKKEK